MGIQCIHKPSKWYMCGLYSLCPGCTYVCSRIGRSHPLIAVSPPNTRSDASAVDLICFWTCALTRYRFERAGESILWWAPKVEDFNGWINPTGTQVVSLYSKYLWSEDWYRKAWKIRSKNKSRSEKMVAIHRVETTVVITRKSGIMTRAWAMMESIVNVNGKKEW